MKQINFDYREVRQTDFPQLAELYSLCFGVQPPADYFHWKLLDNPAGKAVCYVAVDGAKIAAFYGMIPEQYLIDEQPVTFFQSMDTMTHPEYRRMGLFNRLAERTYQHQIAREGWVLVIGFPGETSYPGFIKKLNWQTVKLIDLIFLEKHYHKLRNLFQRKRDFVLEEIESFGEEFSNEFAEPAATPSPTIKQQINREFLNWRIASHPLIAYRIVKVSQANRLCGLVIWKEEEKRRCFIHYVQVSDKELLKKVMNEVCSYLFDRHGFTFIYTFEPTDEPLRQAYEENQFLKNSFNKALFSYKPPFIVFSNRASLEGIDPFNASNYNLQPIVRDY
ncbi:MAG: GNAT family N-acetyltransferase [Acidobacteria bacterium]|nr:GNAT family N-acetyltransferase [Acidobacteriota bacterium]